MFGTVLFDLDHTLLDSHASEALAYSVTMAEAGVRDAEEHFAAYDRINKELWDEVEAGVIGPDDVRVRRFARLIEERGIDADSETMADRYVKGLGEFGELYDGADELLDRLAETVALALVTNGIGQVQRARIERLGIGPYFESIVISAEVGTAKPAPEIFDIAFDELGQPSRSTVLMVGDSLTSDIAGGVNYGIATCWYNPDRGTGPAPIPTASAPTFTIDHLDQLDAIVSGVDS